MSMKIAVFWNVTPCSLVYTEISDDSSEMTIQIYQTTLNHIPNEENLHKFDLL
jgi:hypothetical protein